MPVTVKTFVDNCLASFHGDRHFFNTSIRIIGIVEGEPQSCEYSCAAEHLSGVVVLIDA